ncbi:hypothetical protein OUZ56_018610 [Daphnia magna]|uniref:Uncharacterized protein n=1 Tax=Daphnia magna TaxID=35525 RepID=A0ABQ9Z9H3_9CRUS|nr:hypothetical protein OUZ56_018610 [Daphnia magna]
MNWPLQKRPINVQYPAQKSEHRFNFLKPPSGGEGRRGDGHIRQGWLPVHNFVDTDGICVEPLIATAEFSVRFPIRNCNIFDKHNNSSPHLESNTDLQHQIQKRYTYAIDNDTYPTLSCRVHHPVYPPP